MRHRSRVEADVALECAVCSEDDGDDGLECAICFETAAPSAKELSSRATDDASSPPAAPRRPFVTLACSHAFCAPCIAHVADATLQHGTRSVVVPCPLCKRPLEAADLSRALKADAAFVVGQAASRGSLSLADLAAAGPRRPPVRPSCHAALVAACAAGAAAAAAADRARASDPEAAAATAAAAAHAATAEPDASYLAMARREHWKRCPQCSAPIMRQGALERVTCRCGHRFAWRLAPTVVPCGRVHLLPDGPLLLRLWGYTCPGCRPVARVKLGLVRGGFVGVVVPLAAAVAVAAAAVAVLMIVLPVSSSGRARSCTSPSAAAAASRRTRPRARRQRRDARARVPPLGGTRGRVRL